jgi:capsular exopolysaccharide synthesis family protein
MEIRDYLDVLTRRKWVLILSIFITVAITAAGSLLMHPVYAATATVRIAAAADKTMDYSDYQYADRLMNTYARIVTSAPVLDEVMRKLGLSEPPEVKSEVIADTELISITAEDANPTLARDIANALAEELVARSRGLYTGDSKSATEILSEQLNQVQDEMERARSEYEKVLTQEPGNATKAEAFYRAIEVKQRIYAALLEQYEEARVGEVLRSKAITVVEPATPPEKPSKPDVKMNLLIGLAVGIIGGIGLAFLLDSLDTTLYTMAQVKSAAPLSILGQVPIGKHPLFQPVEETVPFATNGHLALQEAYRRVRTNIFSANYDHSIKIILATSAEPGEGKSTVVANLAKSVAQTGRRVVVVDGDMRRPTLHTIFNVPNETGLSNVLQGKALLQEALQETSTPNVSILTSGTIPENPTELLASLQVSALIKQLTSDFSYVLLDTPAVLPVIDAAVLAPTADGVLLVVRQAQTRREAVQAALNQLAEVNARPLGIIVNGAKRGKLYY